MIICVCSKCKFADLLDNPNEKNCFCCGGSFVSTGYTSDKWIKLTTEEMTKVISDKFEEINPLGFTAAAGTLQAKPVVEAKTAEVKSSETKVTETKAADNNASQVFNRKPESSPANSDAYSANIAAVRNITSPVTTSADYDDFDLGDGYSSNAANNIPAAVTPSADTVGPDSSSQTSSLSIVAFVLSLFGCVSPIALILGIIALAKSKGRKKGLSIAAVIISSLYILGTIAFILLEVFAVTSVFPFLGDTFSNLMANSSDYEEYYNPDEFYEDYNDDTYYDEDYTDSLTDEYIEEEPSEEIIDTTYEEIYNNYSDKLQNEYMKLSSEMEEEITSGASYEELDESFVLKLESLGSIYSLGQEELAALMNLQPATEEDYTTWSSSLEDLYLQLTDNLEVIYQSGVNSDSDMLMDGAENADEFDNSLDTESLQNGAYYDNSDSYNNDQDVYYFEGDDDVYASFGDDI